MGVGEHDRLTNSERRLKELEEEAERVEPRGILELFDRDWDEALTRDDAEDE
jgi:hypothetical protein